MHLDSEVAKALGISARAMRDHAKKIGLTKGEGYEEYFKKEQSRIHYISGKYVRNSGQFQKGNTPAHTFPKGEQPREMIEKRAATMRKQYHEDAVRMKYGLEPKMKFKRPVRFYLNEEYETKTH